MRSKEIFNHLDTDDSAITLHDCNATHVTVEENCISFYFDNGFWIMPDHKQSKLTDIGFSSKRTNIMTIAFVVSQLLCSTLVWCLVPTNIYNAISIVLDLISIVNLAIILMCVFRRGQWVK